MKSSIIFLFALFMFFFSCKNPSVQASDKNNPFIKWAISGQLPNLTNGEPSKGLAGPVAGISNNHLILGGGANFPNGYPWDGGKKKYYKELDIYKKLGDSIVLIKQGFQLPTELAYSANCSTKIGLIIAGGENENGPTNKVLLLDWDSTAEKLNISQLPPLPEALTAGMLAVQNNTLYYAGGYNARETSSHFFSLDLKNQQSGWQSLPNLPKPTTYGLLIATGEDAHTKLYLVGGRMPHKDSISDLYNTVFQFDVNNNSWIQKCSLPYALSAQTGIALHKDSLLVFSGDQGETFHRTERLLMNISKEKDLTKKQQLIKEKNNIQLMHPGFSPKVLAYNLKTDRWLVADSLKFPGQVTTNAFLWGEEVVIPCGEIRAGVRSKDIITGKFNDPNDITQKVNNAL